ncbi:MAG: AtuA-related protein [Acetobacteraceae bacterium]
MIVYDLAHARAGDKGNTSNISATAYTPEGFAILSARLTAERVHATFRHLGATSVTRYELPRLHALNFVIEGVLGGGVTRSLRIDPHGKSLSALMLTIELGNQ